MIAHQWLETVEIHGVTVIYLRDRRLSEGVEIEDLGEELFHLADGETGKKLVLNLSLVEFFSSAGLGKLVALKKKVDAHDGAMVLCCVRPVVHEMFRITKLNRLFSFRETEADAVAAFD